MTFNEFKDICDYYSDEIIGQFCKPREFPLFSTDDYDYEAYADEYDTAFTYTVHGEPRGEETAGISDLIITLDNETNTIDIKIEFNWDKENNHFILTKEVKNGDKKILDKNFWDELLLFIENIEA